MNLIENSNVLGHAQASALRARCGLAISEQIPARRGAGREVYENGPDPTRMFSILNLRTQ
jgi:hypothetical protein